MAPRYGPTRGLWTANKEIGLGECARRDRLRIPADRAAAVTAWLSRSRRCTVLTKWRSNRLPANLHPERFLNQHRGRQHDGDKPREDTSSDHFWLQDADCSIRILGTQISAEISISDTLRPVHAETQ